MKTIKILLGTFVVFSVGAGIYPHQVGAALTYGSGYYTNLCNSGTAATYYNCDPGCNPATGSCQSNNGGAVRWVCNGKWNQCLESESSWSDKAQVDGVGCGYTVQLSLFDKKCRRIDGSWDNTCKLMGYMAWYSGDCREGISPTAGPIRSVTPTATPKPTVTPIIPSPSPTLTPVPIVTGGPTPTPSTAALMCGVACKVASDCKIGFACVQGACRNPACTAEKSCFCGQTAGAATGSAISTTSPETGVETWVGMAGMAAIGAVGIRLRKFAKKLW